MYRLSIKILYELRFEDGAFYNSTNSYASKKILSIWFNIKSPLYRNAYNHYN